MCHAIGYSYAEHRRMALEIDSALAASQALYKFNNSRNIHDNVSCDKTQIFYHHCPDTDAVDVLQRLAVRTKDGSKGSDERMFVYACNRKDLGDSDEFLATCAVLPCNADRIRAVQNPREYVKQIANIRHYDDSEPEEEPPVYRSLSSIPPPKIEIPTGTCKNNLDGSKIFTLKIAKLVLTDEQIWTHIRNGTYRDYTDYLKAMQTACINELLGMLRKNGVPLNKVMSVEEELDANGDEVPNAEAVITLTDQLLPVFKPGSDLLVCVPPIVNGEPDIDGCFSVAFRYPDMRDNIPILGLVHGDMSRESSTHKVEGNFYICANVPIELSAANPETNVPCNIRLLSHSDLRRSRHAVDDDDNAATRRACDVFQKEISEAIWTSLKIAAPNSDIEPRCTELFSFNLCEKHLFKFCTGFHSVFPILDDADAMRANVERFEKRKKEAEHAFKSATQRATKLMRSDEQMPQAPSPP